MGVRCVDRASGLGCLPWYRCITRLFTMEVLNWLMRLVFFAIKRRFRARRIYSHQFWVLKKLLFVPPFVKFRTPTHRFPAVTQQTSVILIRQPDLWSSVLRCAFATLRIGCICSRDHQIHCRLRQPSHPSEHKPRHHKPSPTLMLQEYACLCFCEPPYCVGWLIN